MKSFVNLMANDVWSPHDIKSRLHAELRGVISDFSETELKRALLAESKGIHVLTADENATLMLFAQTEAKVALLGVQARADAALHAKVMALESGLAALVVPAVSMDDPEAYAAYLLAETEALNAQQVLLDEADADTLALYELRNPLPEVAV